MSVIRCPRKSCVTLRLMKPGPASEGVPSRMDVDGRAWTSASAAARGLLGAPGCSHKHAGQKVMSLNTCDAQIREAT